MVNEKELSLVKKLFRSIVASSEYGKIISISDVFVEIALKNGEIFLYNDNYDVIGSTIIYSWAKPDYNMPSDQMIRTLNCAIKELEVEGYWDNAVFYQPLNICLVNNSHEVLEELYFLDNEMIVLSEPLLSGYDDDLDSFLKKLFS